VSGPYLLGLDVGGTRTRALVASLEGEVLGFGESGCGNHENVGYEGLYEAMRDALARALGAVGGGAAGARAGEIAAAGFGVAGFDWPSERPETEAAIARLGLACPFALRNDAALGLAAGSSEGWGLNLVAGTSNNCYGRSRSGAEASLSGAGAAVGELGGGLEIAGAALAAVNRARLGRIAPTTLSEALCSLAGTVSPEALVEEVAMGRLAAQASWAPAVFEAARGGDEAALGIIGWAGRELGESAAAVARLVGLAGESFELVLSGSLFGLEPRLEAGIRAILAAAAPGARVVGLDAPPVLGAVVLAAAELGLERSAIRGRLLASFRGRNDA
jgi:N-acetylglucosamine kinase-like BadF-type ATPase